MVGKLRGWDRTVATPAVDWRRMSVDVIVPAKNEEKSIAIALASLFQQDFPVRHVIVFDDAPNDRTSAVVTRYREVTGHPIQLVTRPQPIGKTPPLPESSQHPDAATLSLL